MLRKLVFLSVLSLIIAHPIKAQNKYSQTDVTAGVSDSEVCRLSVVEMEQKYGIKEHLLETIASVETGVWNYEKSTFVSWPWSINVQGKGYRFDTKEEAMAEVKRLQQAGVESIDVGCMQISLKFHGNSFENLDDAFDPDKNVEYSAKFLKKLYDKKGTWQKAAMAYHSKKPSKGQVYKARLLKRFEKIKLAFLENTTDISLF